MDAPPVIAALTLEEWKDLARAKALLENPGLTIKLANAVGSPIEKGFALLPSGASEKIQTATRKALMKGLDVAVRTLDPTQRSTTSSNTFHKFLVGASGGIGGAFGLASLPVELPLSTSIMLRSIADIARSEGHDLTDLETRLRCLEVFALGGRSDKDDAGESGYWMVRAALSRALTEATSFLAERSVVEKTAPAVVRLISAIASRFGVIVSEQVAAKAIPIIGAASGSLVNVLFMDHFQNMARGHFIVKRLENRYGYERIHRVYGEIAITDMSRKTSSREPVVEVT